MPIVLPWNVSHDESHRSWHGVKNKQIKLTNPTFPYDDLSTASVWPHIIPLSLSNLPILSVEKLVAYQREFHALRERLRVAEHRTLQRSSELNAILEQFRRAIAETNGSKDALSNFSGYCMLTSSQRVVCVIIDLLSVWHMFHMY